jgi:hypothetical protein
VRIRKEHTAVSQFIEVRCTGLRVATKHADPVIQIVNGDEQDIWTCDTVSRLCCALAPVQREKRKQTGGNGVIPCHSA